MLATDVPITHSIESDPAHVGACDFCNLHTILLDPAIDIVATFLCTYGVGASDAVLDITKLTRSGQTVHKRTPKRVV